MKRIETIGNYIVNVLFSGIFQLIDAIIFYLCYNLLAPLYFTFLPKNCLYIPLLNMFAFVVFISFLKDMFYPNNCGCN